MARTWIASLTNGIVAGATATLARELISNLDVGIRARPTSDTHERAVQRMADVTHVNLGPAERAAHRRAGIGSVFGFVNGVLAVSLFAAFRGRRRPPLPVAAGVIGIGGMLVADGSMTALGVTDPRRWGAEGWFEDALPYVAYGLVAAATLNRLDGAD
ncbi:hypothetical protein [Micromonospora mirobrigensis]|uniref:Uncharacterized protein n=1 Tax=Micromonospora mirobrigensis TaxID=262898 RepID=A0A1C4YYB2_9ACTN|nr:hypothetical protein [Micromonospora mirobrigensis]SCF25351.1 hypothetical protein GA0070564_104489 [Micromonospora mirobrigensis]